MLATTETITLYRRTYDQKAEHDSYLQWEIKGVSWFSKWVIGTEGKGAGDRSEYMVRIPTKVSLPTEIQTGDMIARGVCPPITHQKELAGREHFTVTSVGDNRRGGLPHWAVRGG